MKNIFKKIFSFVFSKEMILYIVMGILTTIVNWTTYSIFTRIFHTGNDLIDVSLSNIIAWVAGVLFAYVTNKIWVFESKSWEISFVINEFAKFAGTRVLTGSLEWFGLPFLIWSGQKFNRTFLHIFSEDILGIRGGISKIIVSVLVVVLNYIFSKLIIFSKKTKNPSQNTNSDKA